MQPLRPRRSCLQQQPNMTLYARCALLDALAPLIGAEIALGNKAVQRGWADNVSDETVSEWRTAGIREVGATMNQIIESTCASEYGMALRRRLALRRVDPSDQRTILQSLLDTTGNHRLDSHGTTRKLASFRPNILRGNADSGVTALEGLIAELLGGTYSTSNDTEIRSDTVSHEFLRKTQELQPSLVRLTAHVID
ncbi:hypothetical protein BKA83DRAFT_2007036 [Pisolithus microcarpus]|nr:hypothetical protein BKA83DRAFT_2007036 [Pisolithus microcarpus]